MTPTSQQFAFSLKKCTGVLITMLVIYAKTIETTIRDGRVQIPVTGTITALFQCISTGNGCQYQPPIHKAEIHLFWEELSVRRWWGHRVTLQQIIASRLVQTNIACNWHKRGYSRHKNDAGLGISKCELCKVKVERGGFLLITTKY